MLDFIRQVRRAGQWAGNSRWELVSLNPGNEGGGIAGMAFTGVAAMAHGTAVIKA